MQRKQTNTQNKKHNKANKQNVHKQNVHKQNVPPRFYISYSLLKSVFIFVSFINKQNVPQRHHPTPTPTMSP
jgi:hypothetical protein